MTENLAVMMWVVVVGATVQALGSILIWRLIVQAGRANAEFRQVNAQRVSDLHAEVRELRAELDQQRWRP